MAGSVVKVKYKAALNTDAEITTKDKTQLQNSNKVYLEYYNNPNFQDDGEPDTGKTEEDTVFVGTYELPALKTSNDKTPVNLEGATFKLQSVTSGKWATFKEGTTIINGWVDSKENAGVIVSGEDGKFGATGLDAGDYKLYETKAPAGYNTPTEPFTITVVADHDGKAENQTEAVVNKIKFKLSTDENEGDLVTIKNSKAGSLPETGGMGTTLIYGAGALMVAGAAVVYVTNKRTRKD